MSNDRTLYDVEVPEGERLPSRRTPDAYRVIVRDKWQPCMVLGLYHGQWHDHPGNDWLIRHLLEKKTEADATIDRLTEENAALREREDYWTEQAAYWTERAASIVAAEGADQ